MERKVSSNLTNCLDLARSLDSTVLCENNTKLWMPLKFLEEKLKVARGRELLLQRESGSNRGHLRAEFWT